MITGILSDDINTSQSILLRIGVVEISSEYHGSPSLLDIIGFPIVTLFLLKRLNSLFEELSS